MYTIVNSENTCKGGVTLKYIIGIDGGGTKTKGYIGDESGNIIAEHISGASNYHAVGIQNTRKAIQDVVSGLCSAAGINIQKVSAVSLGMAGLARKEDRECIDVLMKKIGFESTLLCSDAYTSLIGAFGGERGVVTICGTGSISMGFDAEGNIVRAGGWGHIISDEGSGYYIGCQCLRKIMRIYDGMEEKSLLTGYVLDYLNMKSEEELISYIYSKDTGKREVASLSPLVFRASDEGDKIAIGILQRAAESLCEITETVIKKLYLSNDTPLVACDGGILRNVPAVRNRFESIMKSKYEGISIKEPLYDGGIGAYILAARKFVPGFDHNNIKVR